MYEGKNTVLEMSPPALEMSPPALPLRPIPHPKLQSRSAVPIHPSEEVLDNACDNSDGDNFCACQLQRSPDPEEEHEACMFRGRSVEPLAFALAAEHVVVLAQEKSPLFALPREIRDAVYTHALRDTHAVPAAGTRAYRAPWNDETTPQWTIALALLSTCRAVYLETFRLPFTLNAHTVYHLRGPFRPDLKRLAPWQAAAIQRLDVGTSQMALERGELRNWLGHWGAGERARGAYVAPRWRKVSMEAVGYHHPFPFDTVAVASAEREPSDGDVLTLPIKTAGSPSPGFYADVPLRATSKPTRFAARAALARPLTHLTLRITPADWTHWEDDPPARPAQPRPSSQQRALSLDPAVGVVSGSHLGACSAGLMHLLAAKRRAGLDVQGTGTWGAVLGRLPDLRELVLVLETHDVKRAQLEDVVACARTWRFPLRDAPFELVCDGEVQDASYAAEAERSEDEQESEFELDDEESEFELDDDDDDKLALPPRVPMERPFDWKTSCAWFEGRAVRYARRRVDKADARGETYDMALDPELAPYRWW